MSSEAIETKICSKCGEEKLISLFRKERQQCIDCVNEVRREGHQRKIAVEQMLLERDGVIIPENFKVERKRQWYLENKVEISQESKEKYLDSRENRLERAHHQYYDPEKVFALLVKKAKQRSKRTGLLFDLDEGFIKKLFLAQSGKCAVTGIEFILEKDERFFRRPFAPSVDRINSKFGYTKDNIRIVCTIVNIALGEFGDEVFDKMCRSYIENLILSRS